MLEFVTNLIVTTGYFGVAAAMFLENIFPPIPSELIMIFSGTSAGKGDLNIFLVILAGTIGSTLGIIPWYFVGKLFGQERLKRFAKKHGRLLTFSPKDIDQADEWFAAHGDAVVFWGRFIPAVRTFISIPAGIARMNLKLVMIYGFLGSLIWNSAFAGLGYFIGENAHVFEKYVDIITYIVLIAIVLIYLYRVITFKKHN